MESGDGVSFGVRRVNTGINFYFFTDKVYFFIICLIVLVVFKVYQVRIMV